MNDSDFKAKVKELLESVGNESSSKLSHLMKSGCGINEDIDNDPDDSYLVAKAFVVALLRSHAEVWSSSNKVNELASHYERF